MQRNLGYLACSLLLAGACADAPTGPAGPDAQADLQVSAANPVVFRDERGVLISTQDPATDLRVVIGLPANPLASRLCGGSEAFDLAEFQEVHTYQEAVVMLAKADEVNVHLYRRSTYRGVCFTTPLAVGTGRLVYTDNDAFGSPTPRHNSFGFSLLGDVTFSDGSTGTVHARNQIMIQLDGTFNTVVNFIQLNS